VRKNGKMQLWHDYVKEANEPADTTEVLDYSRPLVIANAGRFRGYISCFRVLTNALDSSQMLHASNDPNFCPRTICHWSFDGAPGGMMSTISNSNASAYADAFGGLQYAYVGMDGSGMPRSEVSVYTNEFAYGMPFVMEGKEVLVESRSGGGFPYQGGFSSATLPQGEFVQTKSGSFTIETFFKFVGSETWLSRPGRPSTYCTVAAKPANPSSDGLNQDFWFGLWISGSGSLVGHVRTNYNKQVSWSVANAQFYDRQWHHYAYVYDEENLSLRVYFDYELVKSVALDAPMLRSADSSKDVLNVGWGGYSAAPFEGVLDEFRYSNGALDSDCFLRLRHRSPHDGIRLIFR